MTTALTWAPNYSIMDLDFIETLTVSHLVKKFPTFYVSIGLRSALFLDLSSVEW